MRILFDSDDFPHAKKLKDERFKWLQELGAATCGMPMPKQRVFCSATGTEPNISAALGPAFHT